MSYGVVGYGRFGIGDCHSCYTLGNKVVGSCFGSYLFGIDEVRLCFGLGTVSCVFYC